MKYDDIINEEDKRRNIMNILVYGINTKAEKENIYQMNKIICFECKEDILLYITKL